MGRYSKETLKKMSEARKKAWKDKNKRDNYIKSMNTLEYKEKQRLSNLGDKNNSKRKDVRIKISESKKGIKRSEEVKRKISLKVKKAMKRDDVKKKLELRSLNIKYINKISGENNSNWKGGISLDEYCPIFSLKEFKNIILERDKHVCQNCGITRMLSLKVYECNLSIHHIDYNKKNCDLFNLITVCKSCNTKANYNREYWKNFYFELIGDIK